MILKAIMTFYALMRTFGLLETSCLVAVNRVDLSNCSKASFHLHECNRLN